MNIYFEALSKIFINPFALKIMGENIRITLPQSTYNKFNGSVGTVNQALQKKHFNHFRRQYPRLFQINSSYAPAGFLPLLTLEPAFTENPDIITNKLRDSKTYHTAIDYLKALLILSLESACLMTLSELTKSPPEAGHITHIEALLTKIQSFKYPTDVLTVVATNREGFGQAGNYADGLRGIFDLIIMILNDNSNYPSMLKLQELEPVVN